jgi:prevent-host-death family protein
MIVSLSEAKTHLSQLVDRAHQGETIVIAKHNLPLADLVPHKPKGKRRLGLLAGKFSVPDDFSREDEEINKLFYGQGG